MLIDVGYLIFMETNRPEHRNFLITIGEWWEQKTLQKRSDPPLAHSRIATWLPTPGNMLFTVLIIGTLLWVQNLGMLTLFAAPNVATASTGAIAYQGRLANSSGNPLTQTVNMTFRLYTAASGGMPLWEESWTGANSVQVSDVSLSNEK